MSWKPTTWTGGNAVVVAAALLGVAGYALIGSGVHDTLEVGTSTANTQRSALDALASTGQTPSGDAGSLLAPEDVAASLTAAVGASVEVTSVEVTSSKPGERTVTSTVTLASAPGAAVAAAQALNDTPEHTVTRVRHSEDVSTLTVSTALDQEASR